MTGAEQSMCLAVRFEALPEFDCMVSAANSFGLMDGGVDLAITRFFGVQLMERVQAHILQEYVVEQPIGTSFIIDTGHPKHPFVAHTPTMRVTMAISTTDNVYAAMWAMLLPVRRHNISSSTRIRRVACPGLGTATGRVSPNEAARQMALAHHWYLHPLNVIDWPAVQARQAAIGRGGDFDVSTSSAQEVIGRTAAAHEGRLKRRRPAAG